MSDRIKEIMDKMAKLDSADLAHSLTPEERTKILEESLKVLEAQASLYHTPGLWENLTHEQRWLIEDLYIQAGVLEDGLYFVLDANNAAPPPRAPRGEVKK
jgi:hypothetical protein